MSGSGKIAWLESWRSLHAYCQRKKPLLAILNPYHPEGEGLQIDECLKLSSLFEFVVPIVYANFHSRSPRHLIELAEAGIREVVGLDGGREVPELISVIRNPPSSSVARSVLQAVEATYGAPADPVLEFCIAHAHERLKPRSLAKEFFVSPSTLSRRLAKDDLPSPGRIIVWGRLLVAAWLIENGGWSVTQIASYFGDNSPNTLRNQFRRYWGASPGNLIVKGGISEMIAAMIEKSASVEEETSPLFVDSM